jgi:hypothetical protein
VRFAHPRVVSALVAFAALAAFGGCGTDEPEPPQAPVETVDKLPSLPGGWHEYVNHRAGFAIGRPPGWRAEGKGSATLLRSPDQLVAVSISADRTTEAIDFPLAEYARSAARALPRFKRLNIRAPRSFKAHYKAQAVSATGKTKDGLRQRLLFIALRRGQIVTYAVLIARNVEKASSFYNREALRMVRTLRGRPIG